MTQLYTVSFTTRAMVRKLDSKGREISTTRLDRPVTITALPHKTAMSYSLADNFKIERYVPDQGRASKFGSGRDLSVGNGTKSRSARVEPVVAAANTGRSRVSEAAATGNLGAALNV